MSTHTPTVKMPQATYDALLAERDALRVERDKALELLYAWVNGDAPTDATRALLKEAK